LALHRLEYQDFLARYANLKERRGRRIVETTRPGPRHGTVAIPPHRRCEGTLHKTRTRAAREDSSEDRSRSPDSGTPLNGVEGPSGPLSGIRHSFKTEQWSSGSRPVRCPEGRGGGRSSSEQ